MLAFHRDAAFRRPQALPCHVKKNRAPRPLLSRRIVISKNGDKIVKMVGSPKALCASAVGHRRRAIVIRIAGLVAPSVLWRDAGASKRRFGPVQAVWPVVDFSYGPPACRCAAVTFPLTRDGASAPNRHGKV